MADEIERIELAVKLLGGQTKVAHMLDHSGDGALIGTTQQTVWHWIRRKGKMPAGAARFMARELRRQAAVAAEVADELEAADGGAPADYHPPTGANTAGFDAPAA